MDYKMVDGVLVELTEEEIAERDKPIVPGVPQTVEMAQARLALFKGGYLDQVEIFLNGIEDSVLKSEALIEWDYRATVVRTNRLVQVIQAGLQLTDKQIDDLFMLADSL